MTLRIKLQHLLIGIVAGALLVGGGYALATTRDSVVRACVNPKTHALTVAVRGRCPRRYRSISWNQRGPSGAAGRAGRPGRPATVSIGTVTTEPAGSAATVTNAGSSTRAILNFGIPSGATGATGPTGAAGANSGPTAYGEVWMGSTAAQLAGSANSRNIVNVGGGGGLAAVQVTGCSASGLTAPVINVTANADPKDGLPGRNSSGTAAAYVTSWTASGDVLTVDVTTYDPITAQETNSDFALTVYC